MTLYKLTDASGGPIHGGSGKWSLPSRGKPGKWRDVDGDLVPCENGLHLLAPTDIPHWIRLTAALWVAEHDGDVIRDADKTVARRARLVSRVKGYTTKAVRLFAVDCAEHVLPIYEKHHPGDDRVRACITATRRSLDGRITKEELEKANAAAAYAAADASAYAAAAYAAADASANAAAAYAAADASAYAAASADAAERRWQAKRLCELIGIEYEEGRPT